MTDEERREVAENLRNMCICGCRYKEEFYDLLVETVMRAWDFHEFSDVADRLAELIEPEERTCRMVLDEDATSLLEYDEVFRCTACDEEVVRKTGTTIRFCPMCRARVTDWVVPG